MERTFDWVSEWDMSCGRPRDRVAFAKEGAKGRGHRILQLNPEGGKKGGKSAMG